MIIYNRDCNDLFKTMDDNSVDLIITDPPYDFSLSEKLEIHLEMQRISKGSVIVFSPPENQWILPADQYLFWTKPISTKNTSKKYSRFVEMIFVYREGIWNEGRHWSQYVNVFNDFVDSKDHPFRKPPSLIKRLLLNHSHAGSVVFDPFMGSGVVPSVCLAEGRDFIGCEKDMDTFELTKERLVYLTKKRLPELHIGK